MTNFKIVLLCHFTNNEIQNKIKPYKQIQEFAPWIPMFASAFENQNGIELTIISPHKYISRTKHFKLRGVNYYFYNAHIPIIGRHWPSIFKWDYISYFYFNRLKTRILVKNIKPDIIHLFGAENAYYSSTILQFKKKYPIVITIQGFISKTSDTQNVQLKRRIEIEKKLLLQIIILSQIRKL